MVLEVIPVFLGVVLVVLGGSRLSFLMKVFLLKGPGVYILERKDAAIFSVQKIELLEP